MRFCMLTTFFGKHSFGGDAVYVERLSAALLKRGHEVHVVHCAGAFYCTRGRLSHRPFHAMPGLQVHTLGLSAAGMLDAIWSHQTGRLGCKKLALERLFREHLFDVVHLHNMSLLGGNRILSLADTASVKLLTAHDYWWFCPTSLLWKNNRAVCDKPTCFACSIRSQRPPQFWRRFAYLTRRWDKLDAVLFPSQAVQQLYQNHGLQHHRVVLLPGFIPEQWPSPGTMKKAPQALSKPYFAMAGRMMVAKGYHTVIPLMRDLPEFELHIAGIGPWEGRLRKMAAGLTNVKFVGLLDSSGVAALFRNACGVIVPSLFPESFGLVVAEAMALGTPVIAHNRGALPELVRQSGGGLLYDAIEELPLQLRQLANDTQLRTRLSRDGRLAAMKLWSEAAHVNQYLGLITSITSQRLFSEARESSA